jgi:hypothetical protein
VDILKAHSWCLRLLGPLWFGLTAWLAGRGESLVAQNFSFALDMPYISVISVPLWASLSVKQVTHCSDQVQITQDKARVPLTSKMAVLHQYDYIFAISMLFAFLDAWNIGANDVANSFATSVSSRSLTMKQAMLIATVMEFAGAVLVGSRVADTIRSKILSVSAFEQQPAILMLGMMCALIGSSTWLTVATKIGLPVSTTLVIPSFLSS